MQEEFWDTFQNKASTKENSNRKNEFKTNQPENQNIALTFS